MYNRAKYVARRSARADPNRTEDMEEAMEVFKPFLSEYKQKKKEED